jgi:hypothetical protein
MKEKFLTFYAEFQQGALWDAHMGILKAFYLLGT